MKKVAAIHDMSGFGRCSLTVILPVLSVMGLQACPVPTAVLATHTGGFGSVVMQDLTDFIPACLDIIKGSSTGFNRTTVRRVCTCFHHKVVYPARHIGGEADCYSVAVTIYNTPC